MLPKASKDFTMVAQFKTKYQELLEQPQNS